MLVNSQFKNLEKLQELNLSRNILSKIEPLVFKNNVCLQNLALNFNAIPQIHKDYFSNSSALKFLDLSKNEIFSMQANSFLHCLNLSHLDLKLNKNLKINEINHKSFKGLKNLVTLDLRATGISASEDFGYLAKSTPMLKNIEVGSKVDSKIRKNSIVKNVL